MQNLEAHAAWLLPVYYDGACPLCSAEIRNLMARNQAGRLRFVDAHAAGFDVRAHFAAPLTQQQVLARMHAVAGDGRVFSGVEVFRLCYEAVGLSQVARVLRWPLVDRLAERLYPWVAAHRHWTPRWLIRAVFERAAQRAAGQRCDGACSLNERSES